MPSGLEFKPNLAEAVERMRRLWNLEEPLDRVPVHIALPAPPGKRADGSFFGRLDDYLAHQEESFRRHAQVCDEQLPVVHPQYGHALISALCGSPVQVVSETLWSVPILRELSEIGGLRLDWDNDWGRRFRADYERLLEWARGRCAVSAYEVEGVSDTMAALRGATQLCLDFADAPDAVDRFAEKVTDLLIEFGRWNNEHVGARQDLLGGVALDWRLWMPRDSIGFTEDHSVMYSRELYRRFIKPRDARLASSFTRTLLEVHAEGNHQIAEFGEIEGVSMMPIQNPLKMRPEHADAVKNLLGRKAFSIGAPPGEIEDLLQFTGTRGILLATSAADVTEVGRLLHDLERWTASVMSHKYVTYVKA